MDFDYLFYKSLPKGVKSINVNRKTMSLNEFNQARENFLSKKARKVES